MKRKFFKIAVFVFTISLLAAGIFAPAYAQEIGKIDDLVLKSTVKVITAPDSKGLSRFGTGFIVSVPSDATHRYFFLVTTKHLLGDYSIEDGKLKNIYDYLLVYLYGKNGTIQEAKILLHGKNNKGFIDRVFVHPQPYIDVAIISISDALDFVNKDDKVSLDISLLPTEKDLKFWHIDIGDQVFALGYPNNIYSQSNNYPIAKSGYIASKVGDELSLQVPYMKPDNTQGILNLKGKFILLDGVLVTGHSGWPIVIPRGRRELTKSDTGEILQTNKSVPNFVIAMQSQTFLDTGINFAISSEYIRDLIMDTVKRFKSEKLLRR